MQQVNQHAEIRAEGEKTLRETARESTPQRSKIRLIQALLDDAERDAPAYVSNYDVARGAE